MLPHREPDIFVNRFPRTPFVMLVIAAVCLYVGGALRARSQEQDASHDHVIHQTVYLEHCPNGGTWSVDMSDSDHAEMECFYRDKEADKK